MKIQIVLKREVKPGLNGFKIETIKHSALVQAGGFDVRRVGDRITNAEADALVKASRYEVTTKA